MKTEEDFAVFLAQQAGIIMKKHFASGFGVNSSQKKDHSPVTAADLEIDGLVCESLQRHYPDYDIFSEESEQRPRTSEYLWICDPIDGTIPYSHGIPVATFSLALVYNGQPILGLIYDPFLDRMFVAKKGHGAWLNGQRIVVSPTTQLLGSSVGCDFLITKSHFNFRTLYEELHYQEVRTMTMCSALYSGSLVARGQFIASIYGGNKPYDVAALKVIVEEAGGKVTDLAGNDQYYDKTVKGLITSNGHFHEWIVGLLKF